MPDNQVKLVITTDSTGAVTGINGVTTGLKKMDSETGGIMNKMKSHWLGISAAVAGSMVAIQKAWDLADMTSQYNEQMTSLDSLAAKYGETASSIVSDIQNMSKGMISQVDAVQIASEGLLKGMSPEQMKNLAAASETFSNVSGRKVVDIMGELSEALETGKMRALKMQLGIIDLDAVYGNAVSTMTEAEKAQAMYNIVMEKTTVLQRTLGDSTESTNDKMEQFTTTLKDGQLAIGQLLLKGAQLVVAWGQAWTAGTFLAVTGISKVAQGLGWVLEKLPFVSNIGKSMKDWGAASATAAWDTMKEQLAKSKDNIDMIFTTWGPQSAAKSIKSPAMDTGHLKKETDSLISTLKIQYAQYEKYYTDLKKLQDDCKQAIEKSLKDIAEIDKRILESRKATQELLYQVGQKGNPASNEMEEYTRKQARDGGVYPQTGKT
jgi:hypothetical protein